MILDRALAKDPKDRYQKIALMRDDLRGVLQEISGMPILQGDTFTPHHLDENPMKRAWNWLTGKSNSTDSSGISMQATPSVSISPTFSPDTTLTASGQEKKSVAILPFKNLSGDPNANFYEFSLADAVITELAGLRSLIVRPSSVIAKYQGAEIDPRQAGQELRVQRGFIRRFHPFRRKNARHGATSRCIIRRNSLERPD